MSNIITSHESENSLILRYEYFSRFNFSCVSQQGHRVQWNSNNNSQHKWYIEIPAIRAWILEILSQWDVGNGAGTRKKIDSKSL